MKVNRIFASVLGILALGWAVTGIAAPLPSGRDTLDLMAISGPVVQSVPNTSALLLVVTWLEERTHAAVLTIQESVSRKFIAEIWQPADAGQNSAASPTEIWVDRCFSESGKACGNAGTRFKGSAEDLQALIVQSIQQHEGAPSAGPSAAPAPGASANSSASSGSR